MNRWPVTIEVPVQWGDMDSFGHVNNVVYLRWFETARIEYFARAGVLDEMPRVGPILARHEIDYRLPLTWPDRVRVLAKVTKLGNTSFTMGLELRSEARDALAAEGVAVIVMVDYEKGGKVPLSKELRQRIEALESGRPQGG